MSCIAAIFLFKFSSIAATVLGNKRGGAFDFTTGAGFDVLAAIGDKGFEEPLANLCLLSTLDSSLEGSLPNLEDNESLSFLKGPILSTISGGVVLVTLAGSSDSCV